MNRAPRVSTICCPGHCLSRFQTLDVSGREMLVTKVQGDLLHVRPLRWYHRIVFFLIGLVGWSPN